MTKFFAGLTVLFSVITMAWALDDRHASKVMVEQIQREGVKTFQDLRLMQAVDRLEQVEIELEYQDGMSPQLRAVKEIERRRAERTIELISNMESMQ